MAVKRYLIQPSNPTHKKNKLEFVITVEDLKASMLNESAESETVVLGTKIFAVSQLGSMVDILLRPIPAYDFIKEDGEEEFAVYSIDFRQAFSEEEMRLFLDKLDLNGAAAVFYGDKNVRYHGLALWCIAAKIRSNLQSPEVEQTLLQKRVLNGKQEAWTLVELKGLLRQRRKHWTVQAILKTQRVLKQNNLYQNYFVFDSYYNSIMKGWEKRNLTPATVFSQVLFFFEKIDLYLLKRRHIIQIVETVLLVLNELQKVFQAPNATFEELMVCLSFATRFNLATLAEGYKEGAGMDGIHLILKRVVQMPNRDQSRLTTLMDKFLKRFKKLLPPCVPSHHAFTGLKNLDMEPSFQRENWLIPVKIFLSLNKPSVKSLLCVTASHVKTLYVEEDLQGLPFVGIDNLLTYH